jgi:hypothetical protein
MAANIDPPFREDIAYLLRLSARQPTSCPEYMVETIYMKHVILILIMGIAVIVVPEFAEVR